MIPQKLRMNDVRLVPAYLCVFRALLLKTLRSHPLLEDPSLLRSHGTIPESLRTFDELARISKGSEDHLEGLNRGFSGVSSSSTKAVEFNIIS